MTEPVLEYRPETTLSFVEEVMERSGQNIIACYQCRRCAAGCPVGEETGYLTPDRLIRMILLGDRDRALNNDLVWKCVSCYTCGTRCPNEIQTARITETLKHMVKKEHLKLRFPKVAAFHAAFCSAARHLGRINELEFMGLYEMKNTFHDLMRLNFKDLFKEGRDQAMLGIGMAKNRRMHFGVEKVGNLSEVKRLYKRAKKRQKEAARP